MRFDCNVCGSGNEVPVGGNRELDSCAACGATLRARAVVLSLSRALFQSDLTLPEFPRLKSMCGLGISDSDLYSARLDRLFSYTNTYFHREPRLDLTDPPREAMGRYDFIICSDVLEHVDAPVEKAVAALRALLKATGFAIVTVPYGLGDATVEHFSRFRHSSLTTIDGRTILVGHDGDGTYEVVTDLVFHGGPGATLERRMFSQSDLERLFQAGGFPKVHFDSEGSERFGVTYDSPCSLPIVVSNGDTALPPAAARELLEAFADGQRTLRLVKDSKWVRLGRQLGLGPQIK